MKKKFSALIAARGAQMRAFAPVARDSNALARRRRCHPARVLKDSREAALAVGERAIGQSSAPVRGVPAGCYLAERGLLLVDVARRVRFHYRSGFALLGSTFT
ncbi:MAG TPA: hypothetical protein VN930_09765 [Xanthobacteraceae bacterium]|nr:hypothetical protein [Xanthobacteraceae bacterium]